MQLFQTHLFVMAACIKETIALNVLYKRRSIFQAWQKSQRPGLGGEEMAVSKVIRIMVVGHLCALSCRGVGVRTETVLYSGREIVADSAVLQDERVFRDVDADAGVRSICFVFFLSHARLFSSSF